VGHKVLIVTGDGGDSYETLYAQHRLLEQGWKPVLAALARRRLHLMVHDREPGWDTYVSSPGYCLEADVAVTAVTAREFEAIILPGGGAPEYLRNDPSLISLVREFASHGKCLAAIGHGLQVLAAADLLDGRRVACHEHVRVEIERAGAIYLDRPAVRDGRLVTATSWHATPDFYRELFACLAETPPLA
jgi:protease I